MLAHAGAHIRAKIPRLSWVFWLFAAFSYFGGLLAIFAILNADYSNLQATGTVGERAAFHLSVIRLIFISIVLVVFPVLLLTSLRRLFYFLVGVTAWTVIIYVDDALVLYSIMELPQSTNINIVFAIRPFVIIGLIWMCFELNLRLKNGS